MPEIIFPQELDAISYTWRLADPIIVDYAGSMSPNQMVNATDVIDALGGVAAVATLTQTSYRAAHNWKARGQFPPRTYSVIVAALRDKGASASPSLWNMVEPAQ